MPPTFQPATEPTTSNTDRHMPDLPISNQPSGDGVNAAAIAANGTAPDTGALTEGDKGAVPDPRSLTERQADMGGSPQTPGFTPDLKIDGPTVTEYVKAGYDPNGYPPAGYTSRSTDDEIANARLAYLDAKANPNGAGLPLTGDALREHNAELVRKADAANDAKLVANHSNPGRHPKPTKGAKAKHGKRSEGPFSIHTRNHNSGYASDIRVWRNDWSGDVFEVVSQRDWAAFRKVADRLSIPIEDHEGDKD